MAGEVMSDLRWPRVLPAGWFVIAVAGSGFVTAVQLTIGIAPISLQAIAHVALVLLSLATALVTTQPTVGLLAPTTRAALLLFSFSAVASLLLALADARSSHAAIQDFLFVYATGILLTVFLVTPVVVHLGKAFGAFCLLALGFGVGQALTQDLFLPSAFLDRFGLVHTHFVNGNLRIVSFFASPPRFAELLVLMASYLQFGLLTGKRRAGLHLLAYGFVLFALLNTYSRSGYVLFVVTFVAQVVLMRRRFREGSTSSWALRFYFSLSLIGGITLFAVGGRSMADTDLGDSTSWEARQAHWSGLLLRFRDDDWLHQIWGSGTAARFSFLSTDYFVVDNIAIAIYLYGGLVGLLAFLFLYFRIFREGLGASRRTPEVPWEAILAFYLALFAEGMFVDNHNTVFLAQFAILGAAVWSRVKGTADDPDAVGRAVGSLTSKQREGAFDHARKGSEG